jgi:hypothetical protein
MIHNITEDERGQITGNTNNRSVEIIYDDKYRQVIIQGDGKNKKFDLK